MSKKVKLQLELGPLMEAMKKEMGYDDSMKKIIDVSHELSSLVGVYRKKLTEVADHCMRLHELNDNLVSVNEKLTADLESVRLELDSLRKRVK